MLRLLSYAVVLAALVAGTVWLADRPGLVHVEWLQWQIETSVPVLLAALLVIAVIMVFALRLILAVWRIPGRWAASWQSRKLRKGYQALSDGLAAAAAGDGRKAGKLAGKARSLLSDPALTSYLSAQTAKLAGDADAARDHYKAMLERPETAALGLRGLLDQALERGDDAAAGELAARARMIAPGDPWLADLSFTLAMKNGQYLEAQTILADAKRRKAFTPADAASRAARALTARAGAAHAEGRTGEAASLAKKAFSADPKCTQAALELATALKEAGKLRRAAAALESAWKALPAPSLAAAYAGLKDGEDALSCLRRLEKLVSGRPDALESHLVIAEAALDAKIWGQARKHLLAAADLRPTAQTYRLLARLERLEYKNEEAARAWESRIADLAA
ncbi:MAG TPA: heme biosynthesis HemY N-terminal domain-containing protein [Candidatus Sulfotelmatobacter sp.]|jgi:HemY protein|nr:heme biosynthesis HemY N-terminal domain-containing protein [Candidatus Sulfotelmatobacter sp.]